MPGAFTPEPAPSASLSLQIIPAYLYQEYADDDNLQAFINAYNAGAQGVLDFFATNLAYYPGLSAPLLQWVAQGLYGTEETSLASPITPATGPLNTVMLNTTMLNAGTPASETFYNITDDVFKRILTWNLYKGDGKRFTMRWLKRRIARFIFGVDGVDPQPFNNPNFTIGTESTQGISVVVSSHVLTVTLNQALLSAQVQLTPGILTFFELAFLSGALELPLQYTYAVDILTQLVASIVPPSVSSVGSSASQTTPAAAVSTVGGSGSYTYAWTWASGGTGITIGTASASSTDFSASGLAVGTGVTGVAQCVVTDTITSQTSTPTVNVSIERATAVSASASPSSVSVTGASAVMATPSTTVTASGGTGPYTYGWTFSSGGSGLVIEDPSAATTTFESTSLAGGSTASGTAQCLVTDSFGQTTTVDVAVSITRVSAVTASASPGGVSVEGAAETQTTPACTITASGGGGTFIYSWGWQSGGYGIGEAGGSVATWSATLPVNTTASGVALCTVTDQYGQSATATCAVSIQRVSTVSASVSPASESSSAVDATQTTGAATVTASGGSGTYTYAWIWSSGGSGIAINSPSSRTTTFTAADMTQGETYSGVAQCTVMDAYGQTAVVTVSVSIMYAYAGSGSAVIDFGKTTSGANSWWGYYTGESTGSLVSSTLNHGTLAAAYTSYIKQFDPVSYVTTTYVSISGLTADPGQNGLFTTMSTSLGSRTAASASTYSYISGTASWSWSADAYWESGTIGTHYTITFT